MNDTEPTNQPTTEAIETAAAVPTDLAWSRESETVELARRDWRGALRWAALVALLCSTVGAVVWFSLVLYHNHNQQQRPMAVLPTTTAVRPPAPPPPATVTVTPAPTVVPPTAQPAPSSVPSTPWLTAADQDFLSILRKMRVGYPSPDYAIAHAHQVCSFRLNHPHDDAAAANYVATTTVYSGVAATEFADYAAVAYCPNVLPRGGD
jgi:Protein of unknown function (DUF732)